MLSKALVVARQSMRDDTQRVRGPMERDHLALAVKLLDFHAQQLCERFPAALKVAFHQNAPAQTRLGVMSGQGLRLEQLELMSETQVQERVDLARTMQRLQQVSEAALHELDRYVCALLRLEGVDPQRNPLRPDSYVSALQWLMADLSIPPLVRMIWLQHLASPLGVELGAAYSEWTAALRSQGVEPVGYAVVRRLETHQVADSAKQAVAGRSTSHPGRHPEHRQAALTLDRLRRLMAGELDRPERSPKEVFGSQFAREFEAGSDPSDTGFEATVPAAFEALQEMQQVDQVVQRMEQRPGLSSGTRPEMSSRAELDDSGQQAQELARMLSLEVVTLMIDNLVKDTRLLEPVREVIARLEPALLSLALVDPRFFLDRQHPARQLLQEISGHGLAFGSVHDPDFSAFLVALQRHVSPLADMSIKNALPFEQALKNLQDLWNDVTNSALVSEQMDSAMVALSFAEKRNLLADEMAAKMQAIPDMQSVPAGIVEFLCGPWAQVMAGAELNDTQDSDDPGQYKELVTVLLWSAQPALTGKNIARLTKLVPRLLSKLREGLSLIDYPSVKTSAFFDMLMKLHQQAFKPESEASVERRDRGLAPSLVSKHDPWVAPQEAKASGFMEMPDDRMPPAASEEPKPEEDLSTITGLSVGAWVELQTPTGWQRTQLSWISPQGSMYLFTSVQGKTQSMTLRMLERMRSEGTLRVVSDQPIVDGALDAVVHTAMLNSLDVRP